MHSSSNARLQFAKFLRKDLFFILLLLLVNTGVGKLYILLVESHSYSFRMEAQFEEYKNVTNILFAGDSHTIAALNPQYISRSFATAVDGENIIQTYYRLFDYLEKEQLDIKLVILPIDIHSFSSFRLDRYETPEYWKKYINYVEVGSNVEKLPTYLGFQLAAYFPYIGGFNDTLDIIKIHSGYKSGFDQLIKGFRARETYFYENGNPLVSAQTRADIHFKDCDIFPKDAVTYFKRILNLMDEHQVNLVLIRFPVTKEYYEAASEIIEIDEYYRKINRLLEDRDRNYLWLDYHDLYWDKPLFFRDSDHLNIKGAKNFTQLIKQELEAEGLLP